MSVCPTTLRISVFTCTCTNDSCVCYGGPWSVHAKVGVTPLGYTHPRWLHRRTAMVCRREVRLPLHASHGDAFDEGSLREEKGDQNGHRHDSTHTHQIRVRIILEADLRHGNAHALHA